MRTITPLAAFLVLVLASVPLFAGDVDTDGDGLVDFQEVHKYRTDPRKADTGGDGVLDGDWNRRREFTYTVRAVLKVREPVAVEALNDDYQDARILVRGDDWAEIEVIHYPLNTNAEAIKGDLRWRQTADEQRSHLKPGITTDWNSSYRDELIAALKAHDIDTEKLDDKALVQRVSRWLLSRSRFQNMFCTYFIHYPDRKPSILPGLEQAFESNKGSGRWSFAEQVDRELLGRSMFANRTYGTCTSAAVYLTTALRALGIPTRMVLAIPLVDANDEAQIEMASSGLSHHQVRHSVGLAALVTKGFASHTFNEAFVGGRWVRLDYAELGKNSLSDGMGLLTKINAFDDLSDVPLAETWGRRYGLGERDATFRTANPYKAESVSDHFGRFAKVGNPEVREHRRITLTRAYWFDSADRPAFIAASTFKPGDGIGHILVHGNEWFADQSYIQYKLFLSKASREFLLRSEGQKDVPATLSGWYFTNPSEAGREIEFRIAPADYEGMIPEIDYQIVPRNERPEHSWAIPEKLTIRRPK